MATNPLRTAPAAAVCGSPAGVFVMTDPHLYHAGRVLAREKPLPAPARNVTRSPPACATTVTYENEEETGQRFTVSGGPSARSTPPAGRLSSPGRTSARSR